MKPLRQAASLLPPAPVVTQTEQVEQPKEVGKVTIAKMQEVVETATTVDKPTQNRVLAFFKSMLSDSHDDNAISSKRVLALLAFIFCSIGYFVDLFSTNSVTPHIYDSMMWIVIAGIGISGLEKFAPKE